jgi:hypothetical protein
MQILEPLARHGQANQPTAVRSHEVDSLRRRFLGSDCQIALVLSILIIDNDHESTGAEVLQDILDR